MFCKNCGRENKIGNSYCIGCGIRLSTNINNVVQHNVVNNNLEKNNKDINDSFYNVSIWVLRIIGVLFVICVIAVIGSVFFVMNANQDVDRDYVAEKEEYVYFGEIQIPTIYKLIEKYDLCSEPEVLSYDARESVEYCYCDDYIDIDVLEAYSDLLIKDHGFVKQESNDERIILVNESLDEKYNIQVTVFNYRESVEYTKVMKVNLKEEDNSL